MKFAGKSKDENCGCIRIPKFLFENKKYEKLSSSAKILYGLLFEKMLMCREHDDSGLTYITFPIKSVMESIGCSNKTATSLFEQLESYNLISRKNSGFGTFSKIYIPFQHKQNGE